MPDRLAEIRARLDAANLPTYTGWDPAWNSRAFEGKHDFIANAPADIAWLLARLEAQKSMADEYRFELDRLRVRIAQGYNDRA
jgi:hypothetical protein